MNLFNTIQPTRVGSLADATSMPALHPEHIKSFANRTTMGGDPPRILPLYGSLRELSYSRLVVEEAARLLQPSPAMEGVRNSKYAFRNPEKPFPKTKKPFRKGKLLFRKAKTLFPNPFFLFAKSK